MFGVCLVASLSFGPEWGGVRLWSTTQSLERFGTLEKKSISIEKTMQLESLQDVDFVWNTGSAVRQFEFEWIPTYDQVSLSFLPQRQPLQRVDASQGALGDQGFEIFSQGNSIRALFQGAEERSVQEGFSSRERVEWLAIDSDRSHLNQASRSLRWRSGDADAVVFFYQERPCTLSNEHTLLPLRGGRIVRSSLEVYEGKRLLIPGAEWQLCKQGLEFLHALSLDQVVVRFQEIHDPALDLALDLGEPPISLKAERIEADQRKVPLHIEWKRGKLSLSRDAYRTGARIRVTYEESVLSNHELRLPHEFEAESLVIYPEEPCHREEFLLEQRYVSARCLAEKVRLHYQTRRSLVPESQQMVSGWELPRDLAGELQLRARQHHEQGGVSSLRFRIEI